MESKPWQHRQQLQLTTIRVINDEDIQTINDENIYTINDEDIGNK